MIYRAITGENLDILDTIFGKSGDAVSPFEQLKDFSKTSDSLSKAADALQTVADSLLLFNDVDEEKLNRILNLNFDKLASNASAGSTAPGDPVTSAGLTASSALVAPGIYKDTDQRNAAQLFGDEDDQGQPEIKTKETPKAAPKGVSVLGKTIAPSAVQKKSKSKTGPNKDIELAHELALKMGLISEGDTQVKLDIETRGNVPVLINGQKVPTELYTKQQFEQVQGALSVRKAMNMEGDNEKLKEPEVFAKEATEEVALSAEGSVQVPKTDEMSVPQARKLESQNRATAIRAKKELSKVQSKTESNIPVGQESRPMVESNNKLIEKLESLIANIRPMVRSNTSSSASLASMASNNTQATIYSNSVDRDIPYVERNKYRQQLLYVRGLL